MRKAWGDGSVSKLCKHEELSSKPQNPNKESGTLAQACDPGDGETETRGSRRFHWPYSLAKSISLRSKTNKQTNRKAILRDPDSNLYLLHTQSHTGAHICVPTYLNTHADTYTQSV